MFVHAFVQTPALDENFLVGSCSKYSTDCAFLMVKESQQLLLLVEKSKFVQKHVKQLFTANNTQ